PLEEGVLRLDHLTEPDLDRGPVYAEFEWWDGKEDPVVLNADMTVNEQWWGRSEGTALTLPDAPVTALVPCAVVSTEESSAPWTVAGLTCPTNPANSDRGRPSASHLPGFRKMLPRIRDR